MHRQPTSQSLTTAIFACLVAFGSGCNTITHQQEDQATTTVLEETFGQQEQEPVQDQDQDQDRDRNQDRDQDQDQEPISTGILYGADFGSNSPLIISDDEIVWTSPPVDTGDADRLQIVANARCYDPDQLDAGGTHQDNFEISYRFDGGGEWIKAYAISGCETPMDIKKSIDNSGRTIQFKIVANTTSGDETYEVNSLVVQDAHGEEDAEGVSTLAAAIDCEDSGISVSYSPTGLPLMQFNPGAPVAIYVDFDGGTYRGKEYRGYNQDGGDRDQFDEDEQRIIIREVTRLAQHFAMFDVNVTTDNNERLKTGQGAWILVTSDFEGPEAGEGFTGKDPVRSWEAPYAIMHSHYLQESEKGKVLAHELAHNFSLRGVGEITSEDVLAFEYPWEHKPDSPLTLAPFMASARWRRNSEARYVWAKIVNDYGDEQDSMKRITQRIRELDHSSTGWRDDDFPDNAPGAMCKGNRFLYREGRLDRPGDVDTWWFTWPGGDFDFSWTRPGVSVAEIDAVVLQDGEMIGQAEELDELEAGIYQLQARSTDEYGLLGEYEVVIDL